MTRAVPPIANATLAGLLGQLAAHHMETWRHSLRVGRLASVLAEQAGLAAPGGSGLALAASLHDIGKLNLPAALLGKAGGLTVEEQAHLRRHPVEGAALLRVVDGSGKAVAIAQGHHERWDGSGYPLGLCGSAIPLAARLVSIVDVYDALRAPRAYKPGRPHAEVMAEMFRMRNQFDPNLMTVFQAAAEAMDAAYRATDRS